MKSCFVMMPFAREFDPVYEQAIQLAAADVHLEAIRADRQTDFNIPDGIIRGIREASVCIADLTGLNSNVVYEVAFTISQKQRLILITQDRREDLPFDLRQFRVHKYERSPAALEALRDKLRTSLSDELESADTLISLLRSMLLPNSVIATNRKYVVAASPLSWRQARQSNSGFDQLRRTSSDHVGIRGLIHSFGLISNLTQVPDLVDPGDYQSKVCLAPAPPNFYSLGSPKANRWTGQLLFEFCRQWTPEFAFRPNPDSDDLRDVRVDLNMNGQSWLPPDYSKGEPRNRRDFGLVVRGPHPCDEAAMLMLLAGRGAIGTEAACRAVTEKKGLEEIKRWLQVHKVDLNEHRRAFWAVVEMHQSDNGFRETKLESLKVIHTGVFERRHSSRQNE